MTVIFESGSKLSPLPNKWFANCPCLATIAIPYSIEERFSRFQRLVTVTDRKPKSKARGGRSRR
jgi:hypothetical protein